MEKLNTLAELREKRGLSQAEVAKLVGMTQQGYGLIERGERNLKAKIIKRLAEIYGVDTDYIIFLALKNNDKLLNKTTNHKAG